MTVDITRTLIIILICMGATFFERALPFLVFRGKEVPEVMDYLGKVLPMAIMLTLTVYCVRNISFSSLAMWAPQLISCAVTVCVHLWKRNTLLSISAGTLCCMILSRIF